LQQHLIGAGHGLALIAVLVEEALTLLGSRLSEKIQPLADPIAMERNLMEICVFASALVELFAPPTICHQPKPRAAQRREGFMSPQPAVHPHEFHVLPPRIEQSMV
jgi:hypothetical protein